MATKTREHKSTEDVFAHAKEIHQVWHKLYRYIVRKFGKDLRGPKQKHEVVAADGSTETVEFRTFDEDALCRRLVGYKVASRITRYVKNHLPEVKVISCDDAAYAGSVLLLVPHPQHGITILFIPQCTGIQNQFFLYAQHYKRLTKSLKKMAWVYKKTSL